MKKITRRSLLLGSLGATQLALLNRFTRVRAATPSGPTKLLVLYVPGGARFHEMFTPLSDAHINRTTPPNTSDNSEPLFFGPEDVMTFSGESGGFAPLRMSYRWNPADPADRTGYTYTPLGYSWVHHELGATTAAIHGIDIGSVAHGSAQVGAMCGLAGGSYRSPALVSLVAQFLHQTYSDSRPVPCVSIRAGGRGGIPRPATLPSQYGPMVLTDIDTARGLVDASDAVDRWVGSAGRTPQELVALGESGPYADRSATNVEAHLMRRLAAIGAGAAGERRTVLEDIHRNYAAVSNTLALDVVSAIESTTPTTVMRPDFLSSYRTDYGFTFGLANYSMDMTPAAEWVLRLLKSNVTSVVYANLGEYQDYDTHGSATKLVGHGALRGQLDIIARILGEMKASPSPDRPGCTLYDDTVVLIQSEFNRSWATGPSRDSEDGWYNPDGHNNVTSVLVSGGAVAGNRQIGNFDIDGMAQSIALGTPVDLIGESGEHETRTLRGADMIATIANLFGMEPGVDFFIPGGYGIIEGLRG